MGETAGKALKNSYHSKSNNKISFEDTLEIMNRRRNPQTEITSKELKEIENESDNLKRNADLEEEQAAYKQTVTNTRVPLHAN